MIPMPASFIAAAIIGIGALPMPYGYYNLLRIIACGMFVWGAVVLYQKQSPVMPWVFAVMAVVFNPVIKVVLEKDLWMIVDAAAAILLIATAKALATVDRDQPS